MSYLKWIWVMVLIGAFLAGGCSSYRGHKLALDGSLVKEPTGVPFQMSRPEYSIKITPKGNEEDEPVHKLLVNYVPDMNQRYTLILDPALFTDGNFTLNIDANGGISTGTSTLTEQITPFISSVGAFTANIIGAIAVPDQQTPFDAIKLELEIAGGQCKAIADRMVELKERGKTPKNNGEKFFKTRFHYLNEDEKKCLKDLKESFDEDSEDVEKLHLTAWKEEKKKFLEKYKDRIAIALVDALEREIKDRAKKLLEDRQKKMNERNTEDPQRFEDEQALVDKAFNIGKLPPYSDAAQLLASFINMPVNKWKARHVLYLEDLIEKAEAEYLQLPSDSKNTNAREQKIADIERQKIELAFTINMVEEYGRFLNLQDFLTDVKPITAKNAKTWAADEYAKIRLELDNLEKTLDSARVAVVAFNKPPTPATVKVEEKDFLNVSRATKKYIEESKKEGWYGTAEGKKAPEFVVVLEPIVELPFLDVPIGVPQKTGGAQ